jgi:hypothetical protein
MLKLQLMMKNKRKKEVQQRNHLTLQSLTKKNSKINGMNLIHRLKFQMK